MAIKCSLLRCLLQLDSKTQPLSSYTNTQPIIQTGWVFVYEISGFVFESSCSHLNFRFRAVSSKEFLWHSGNYTVWINSETRTWHDKNIRLRCLSFFIILLQNFKQVFKLKQDWILN